jgi:hypothetical protein
MSVFKFASALERGFLLGHGPKRLPAIGFQAVGSAHSREFAICYLLFSIRAAL